VLEALIGAHPRLPAELGAAQRWRATSARTQDGGARNRREGPGAPRRDLGQVVPQSTPHRPRARAAGGRGRRVTVEHVLERMPAARSRPGRRRSRSPESRTGSTSAAATRVAGLVVLDYR
jgi:hypothetical protein